MTTEHETENAINEVNYVRNNFRPNVRCVKFHIISITKCCYTCLTKKTIRFSQVRPNRSNR